MWRRGTRTDLQLPLDPVLAAVSVLGLSRVIFGHYFHKFPGEGGVLGWGCRHIRTVRRTHRGVRRQWGVGAPELAYGPSAHAATPPPHKSMALGPEPQPMPKPAAAKG